MRAHPVPLACANPHSRKLRLCSHLIGRAMFDVDDVFEGFSIWLNMWARAAWIFSRALDDTSNLFARGDD